MYYEKLKSEIDVIAKIAESVPENLQVLRDSLEQFAPSRHKRS